ncbi:MAG: 30S ribosomal protein S20 [Candidatus Dojkabacteria bacterium]|nr:30S ribosomal protein S20 [Candidatus Dojkabacteria bacterium]
MPKLASAKKALRVSKRKTAHNRKIETRLSHITRKTLKLIKMGEHKLAAQQLPAVYKATDKAVKRGLIHKNKSARIKSTLTRKVTDLAPDVKTAPKNP